MSKIFCFVLKLFLRPILFRGKISFDNLTYFKLYGKLRWETTLSLGKNSHTCDSYSSAEVILNTFTLFLVNYPVLSQLLCALISQLPCAYQLPCV